MPIYEFKCSKCYLKFERSLKVTESENVICPTCSKAALISKGFRYTTTGAYQRYQCKACGAYSTDTRTIIPHAKLKHLF